MVYVCLCVCECDNDESFFYLSRHKEHHAQLGADAVVATARQSESHMPAAARACPKTDLKKINGFLV